MIQNSIIHLRECAGMNRKQFCEYFGMPYRTVQDWESGNRRPPEYVVRLMEFRLYMEKRID